MTVIAWLLGLIFLALVWPRAVRCILGAIAWLLFLAIAYGLTVWGFVEWGDQSLNESLTFSGLIWAYIVGASLWYGQIQPRWQAFKLRTDSPEVYREMMNELRTDHPEMYQELRRWEGFK